jgi:hypothetical protein
VPGETLGLTDERALRLGDDRRVERAAVLLPGYGEDAAAESKFEHERQ